MSEELSDGPTAFGRVGQNMLAEAQIELLFKDDHIKPYFVALRKLNPEQALMATTGQDAFGMAVSKSRIAEWRENSGRAQAAAEALGCILDRFDLETGEEKRKASSKLDVEPGASQSNVEPSRLPSPSRSSRMAALQLLVMAKAILEEPISYLRARRGSIVANSGAGVSGSLASSRRLSSASASGPSNRKLSDSGISGGRPTSAGKDRKLTSSEPSGMSGGRKSGSYTSESDECGNIDIEDDDGFGEDYAFGQARKLKVGVSITPRKRGRRRKRPSSATSSENSSVSPIPPKKTRVRQFKTALQRRRHSADDGEVGAVSPGKKRVHNKKSLTISAARARSEISEFSDEDSVNCAGEFVNVHRNVKGRHQKAHTRSLSLERGLRGTGPERQKLNYNWKKEFPTSAPPLMTRTHISESAGTAARLDGFSSAPASAGIKREPGTAVSGMWQGPKIRFGAGKKKRATASLLPSSACFRVPLVNSPCAFTESENVSLSPALRSAIPVPGPAVQHETQPRGEESLASPVIHPVHGDINRTYIRYMEDVQLLSQHKCVKYALMDCVERALSGSPTLSIAPVRDRPADPSLFVSPGQQVASSSLGDPKHTILPPSAASESNTHIANGNHQMLKSDGDQTASCPSAAAVSSLSSRQLYDQPQQLSFLRSDRMVPDPEEFFSRQDEEALVRRVRDFVAAARMAYVARSLHG